MKKQIRALCEIGIVYLAASIILDQVLSGYQILLWPALAFAFVFFAAIILGVIWEPRVREDAKTVNDKIIEREDALTQLEDICTHAIDQGGVSSKRMLSERVRALALAAASQRLTEPEYALEAMADENPHLLRKKIGDDVIFTLITNGLSLVRTGDARMIGDCMSRIEEWIK